MPAQKELLGNFVLRSRASTAEAGIISIMACCETLIACCGALWIGIHFSWYPLVGCITVAPLLLLRSTRSVDLGIAAFRALRRDRHSYDRRAGRYVSGILFAMWGLLILVLVRVHATVIAAWEQKLRVFANIPHNWQRFALCTDFTHPPEAVAGVEVHLQKQPSDQELRQITIGSLWNRYWTKPGRRSVAVKCVRTFAYLWVFACLFVPSWTLRLSVKISTIVYLPFIYASKTTSLSDDSLQTRAVQVFKAKHSLYWALFVLFVLTPIPVVIASVLETLVARTPALRHIVNYMTWFPTLHWWNIARGVCAIITVLIYALAWWSCKRLINSRDYQVSKEGARVDTAMRALGIIRGIGIAYVTLCGVIIIWRLAGILDWTMPDIGTNILPRVD